MSREGRTKPAAGTKFHASAAGFSIVDLVITLTITGILAIISVPNGIRQLQIHRLSTAAAIYGQQLSNTRMEAIKQNRTIWLRLDNSAKTAQMQTTGPLGTPLNVGNPQIFSKDVVLDSGSQVDISFDSLGRLNPGPSSFVLREVNSNKRVTVILSPAGKVSVGSMY